MFEWNPVFNFAMNIKHNYLKKFCKVEYKKYEIEENDTTKTVSGQRAIYRYGSTLHSAPVV